MTSHHNRGIPGPMLPIWMTSYQAARQQGWRAAEWDSEGSRELAAGMGKWGRGQTELDPVPTQVPFCPSPPWAAKSSPNLPCAHWPPLHPLGMAFTLSEWEKLGA